MCTKMLEMAGPSSTRAAITTMATSAMISAYSTRPWPRLLRRESMFIEGILQTQATNLALLSARATTFAGIGALLNIQSARSAAYPHEGQSNHTAVAQRPVYHVERGMVGLRDNPDIPHHHISPMSVAIQNKG